MKRKGERERYTQLNAELQKTEKTDKKPFLNEQKQRETIEWEDQRSLQENWRYQENISCKDEHNKGQKLYGLNKSKTTMV